MYTIYFKWLGKWKSLTTTSNNREAIKAYKALARQADSLEDSYDTYKLMWRTEWKAVTGLINIPAGFHDGPVFVDLSHLFDGSES
jgi:hypothetical protein